MEITRKGAPMALLPAFLCLFMSCRDFQPFSEEEMFAAEYQQNFIRTFGKVDPLQHWDFTGCAPRPEYGYTRGDASLLDLPFTDVYGFYKTDGTLYNAIQGSTMFTSAVESGFALKVLPGKRFDIFPVFQTSSPISSTDPPSSGGLRWALQVFIDGENVTHSLVSTCPEGWPMSYNMMLKRNTSLPDVYSSYDDLNDRQCSAIGLKSKAIISYINNESHEKLMYLNLLITGYAHESAYASYAALGSQQSSLNRYMRVVDMARPSNIPDRYDVCFVACEAADLDASVHYPYRYRSLVLMIVSENGCLPELVPTHQQGDDIVLSESEISKRYMIEDLGSASDFDFNDIVVDVCQTSKQKVVVTRQPVVETTRYRTLVGTDEATSTTATVAHLCGTKPFLLTVGDYSFGKVTDPTNEAQTRRQLRNEPAADLPPAAEHKIGWSPAVTVPVEGWDPLSNNISVKVWRKGEEDMIESAWQATFPSDGQIPYIMALPVGTPISPEGQKFTEWQRYTGIFSK